jgi:hypothetical protein
VQEIQVLVADSDIAPAWREKVQRAGVRLLVADAAAPGDREADGANGQPGGLGQGDE